MLRVRETTKDIPSPGNLVGFSYMVPCDKLSRSSRFPLKPILVEILLPKHTLLFGKNSLKTVFPMKTRPFDRLRLG